MRILHALASASLVCLNKREKTNIFDRVLWKKNVLEESTMEESSLDLVYGRECVEECVVLSKASPSYVPVFRCLVRVLMTPWRYLCVAEVPMFSNPRGVFAHVTWQP